MLGPFTDAVKSMKERESVGIAFISSDILHFSRDGTD